jgi:hypothetical protein
LPSFTAFRSIFLLLPSTTSYLVLIGSWIYPIWLILTLNCIKVSRISCILIFLKKRQNPVEELDLSFSVDIPGVGSVDLIPNGRKKNVTDKNKSVYVQAYVIFTLIKPWNALSGLRMRDVFHQLVPASALNSFTPFEIYLLVNGAQKIDVDDWHDHSRVTDTCGETDIFFFWKYVYELDEMARSELLFFVTGSSRPPAMGFKYLQGDGVDKVSRFTIHCVDIREGVVGERERNRKVFPQSHTCFNIIDLPYYLNYEIFRDRMDEAILNGNAGGVGRH